MKKFINIIIIVAILVGGLKFVLETSILNHNNKVSELQEELKGKSRQLKVYRDIAKSEKRKRQQIELMVREKTIVTRELKEIFNVNFYQGKITVTTPIYEDGLLKPLTESNTDISYTYEFEIGLDIGNDIQINTYYDENIKGKVLKLNISKDMLEIAKCEYIDVYALDNKKLLGGDHPTEKWVTSILESRKLALEEIHKNDKVFDDAYSSMVTRLQNIFFGLGYKAIEFKVD